MRIFLVIFAIAIGACDGGPVATGSLVFVPEAAGDNPSLFFATQQEVISSPALVAHAVATLGPSAGAADRAASRLRVVRRGDSAVLDVMVMTGEPREATDLCNAVLKAYVEYRYEGQVDHVTAQIRAVGEKLEGADIPSDVASIPEQRARMAEFRAQLADLAARNEAVRQRVLTGQSDVSVLAPCRAP